MMDCPVCGEELKYNDYYGKRKTAEHYWSEPQSWLEKNIRTSNLDIVIKRQKGAVIFEIKDPAQLNKSLLNDIKRDFFLIKKDSIVIYPEQEIIDTQGVFLEDTSRLI